VRRRFPQSPRAARRSGSTAQPQTVRRHARGASAGLRRKAFTAHGRGRQGHPVTCAPVRCRRLRSSP
jgi:hypothetical protein